MKLADHVDLIRELIESAFDKQFARLGFGKAKQVDADKLPEDVQIKRERFVGMLDNHIAETGNYELAREKLLDELTFTLFNRFSAIKVMEAANLFPPVLTKQIEHGDRSFGHKAWLEINPHMRDEELEGIRDYLKTTFDDLGKTLPLYSKTYPYAMLPDTVSLNDIIDAFNNIEKDPQVGEEIWLSDDVLGWLYESYNNKKKQIHKDSKDKKGRKVKTEYNKISLQSQVYTPRWVVQFLVENSLGKMYLEMYPNSEIKQRYKIANSPTEQVRTPKPLHKVRTIDPACGSGNFLLYAFDFYYELYLDQIENYDAEYKEKDIPKLIIENNLHGIDLDDRAVQLAQLGLYIKAKKKRRNVGELNFRVVSSDFYLPDYDEVRHIFEQGSGVERNQKELIEKIWVDLQYAYKFGSLVNIDEQLIKKHNLIKENAGSDLFGKAELEEYEGFSHKFFINLGIAVEQYAHTEKNTFISRKTRDAIIFLELLTAKYDVTTANPPYTDSGDFGLELKEFIDLNYSKPYKFNTNLYATFIKRCYELTENNGKIALVHPPTFMYIKKFEDVREFLIKNTFIDLFVEWGYLGMFNPSARVDSAFYILNKKIETKKNSFFIKLNNINENKRYQLLFDAYDSLITGNEHSLLYAINQSKLKSIKSWPFIYWISDEFRNKFKGETFEDNYEVSLGLKTGDNEKYLRFHWEVLNPSEIKSIKNNSDWYLYQKGGDYNRWFGNNWLVVNKKTTNNTSVRKMEMQHSLGITAGRQSTKGASFRYKNETTFVDDGTMNVFLLNKENIYLIMGLLNSKLSAYLLSCFNPTVNKQAGDLKRIPIAFTGSALEDVISTASHNCILLKKNISSFNISEANYIFSPLKIKYKSSSIKENIKSFLSYENHISTSIIIHEAIINKAVFKVYELNSHDEEVVLDQEGISIGDLPVIAEAKKMYLADFDNENNLKFNIVVDFISNLPVDEDIISKYLLVKSDLDTLYQSNNNLEDLCVRHQINPINVWYWFNQSNIIPKQRMNILAMEFLADMVREILMEDQDGIVSLVPNAGGKVLLDQVEEKFLNNDFSLAQYSSFNSLLGHHLQEYFDKYFFAEFSDNLNLFPNLPKTPFIWHLTSGPEQGFDCYIIIYKWSRDKLQRLRSIYIENRERALINLQSDLLGSESADDQAKQERIFKQLKEIESFKKKIDELLAEGYDPILDDGVGKNIAPLQNKKMLPYDVLNAGQLKKYLNADW